MNVNEQQNHFCSHVRYYCINSAQTKEIMPYYILQPCNIFKRLKAFILMHVPGRVQLLNISMCFVWRPETSISKSHVLTVHTQ